MIKVLVRCDSSRIIGMGHVFRCLTLATELQSIGNKVEFAVCDQNGGATDLIEDQGFNVHIVPRVSNLDDAFVACRLIRSKVFDVVIKDHYELNIEWDKLVAKEAKLVVIDDRTGYATFCDLYLNPCIEENDVAKDEGWLLAKSRLLGPKYALVGKDIVALRRSQHDRFVSEFRFTEILIYAGGIPSVKILEAVIKEVRRSVLFDECNLTVALGVSEPNPITRSMIDTVLSERDRMIWGRAKLVAALGSTDLLVASGGSIAWERTCLGVPAIHVVVASNQLGVCRIVERHEAGIAVNSVEELSSAFSKISNGWLARVSKRSSAMCDGLGVKRVVQKCAEIL